MAKDIDKKIEALTAVIKKLVNREVAPVAPVLPVAPIAPIAPVIPNNPEDHQLLLNLDKNFVRLDTKVDQIQTDVTDLKKQGTIYVTQPEHSEIVKVCNDHETRIRGNEKDITKIMTWGSALILLVGIIEFFISNFLK